MSTYHAPKVSGKVAMQLDQGFFDFLVPYRKPTLTTREAAKALGDKSVDFVLALIQCGKLEAFGLEAKGDKMVGNEIIRSRPTYTVTRRSVLVYLVSRAQFERDDFLLLVRSTLEAFDAPTLEYTIRAATEIRANKR
jgi:hypothetical protein